jgi:hypothetical protein
MPGKGNPTQCSGTSKQAKHRCVALPLKNKLAITSQNERVQPYEESPACTRAGKTLDNGIRDGCSLGDRIAIVPV